MAITVLINNETNEVDLATATSFFVASEAVLTADDMKIGEYAHVYRLGPSGDYKMATNKGGSIFLSAEPNMVVLDGPATYKITKDETDNGVSIGWEE